MKVVAGLGNPGAQYANTPHSVGFEVVDAIAEAIGGSWAFKRQFGCLECSGVLGGEKVVLVKPQTYMNLSGDSVAPVVKYRNLQASDLIVVHDDIDIPVGRMRIRKTGSCGGHNGVRSVIARLGTGNFTRLKIGVGRRDGDVVAHVLGKFAPDDRKTIDAVKAEAVKAVAKIVADGPDIAMNEYNGWQA
ncbi:MAG: aminoacyl-tRNA hydrolase [Kiritimatiellae bacterium]|nr:aminoacyl-tRNA hydrolase [Kiritimatiellia bacterium]